MFELPEVVTIARQMDEALAGRRIVSADRGNSPHKWVFTNRTDEEFASLLPGKTVGRTTGDGKEITTRIESGLVLSIGDTGGRILLLEAGKPLPKKYHFRMTFEDGASFVVAVQGWGFIRLHDEGAYKPHDYAPEDAVSPLADEFTLDRFASLLAAFSGEQKKGSVKALLATKSRILGIGNGYLQDILFHAGLHPRHEARALTPEDAKRLWDAIRRTLGEAIDHGGNVDERDLFGQPGGYQRILDKHTVGQPCPACGTTIEKTSYMGGTCYFCPSCQT